MKNSAGEMARARAVVISSVLLLLAPACGEESPNTVDRTNSASSGFSVTNALQPDGPLRGIAFTRDVDRKDPNVRPTLRFTTDDTEVTAVIGVGDVAKGSTVTVSWYRVEGLEKRHALFTHRIAVESGGVVSQAVAPKGLAPGIYDAAATMDGHVTHTPFVVQRASAWPTAATAQASTGDEDWNVPDAGDSGWSDGSEAPPQGNPPGPCIFGIIYPGTVPMRDVRARAVWVGGCSTGTLTATVSGPPPTLASTDDLERSHNALNGQTDVCALSGGSDLPGTVVHFEATGSANGSEDYALPDSGKVLLADLEGLPEAGSKVDAGNRIAIHALAMVMPPALGVKTLRVDAGSDLLESVGNLSRSGEPVPCDEGRLRAELITEYTVPADAPPVIELCATGVATAPSRKTASGTSSARSGKGQSQARRCRRHASPPAFQ